MKIRKPLWLQMVLGLVYIEFAAGSPGRNAGMHQTFTALFLSILIESHSFTPSSHQHKQECRVGWIYVTGQPSKLQENMKVTTVMGEINTSREHKAELC